MHRYGHLLPGVGLEISRTGRGASILDVALIENTLHVWQAAMLDRIFHAATGELAA